MFTRYGCRFDNLRWVEGSLSSCRLPSDPGVYVLLLDLPQTREIQVGRLGQFAFPAGRYFYTGSALSGLRSRLGWHLRQDKSPRWHIDYLRLHAEIPSIGILPTTERLECQLHQEAMTAFGGQVIVRGLGASDCRCASHLGFTDAKSPYSLGLARLPTMRQGVEGHRS